jgi:hypothetical protein
LATTRQNRLSRFQGGYGSVFIAGYKSVFYVAHKGANPAAPTTINDGASFCLPMTF